MKFNDFTLEQQERLAACVTPEEAQSLLTSGEFDLTDDQLEAIAGGKWFWEWPIWKMVWNTLTDKEMWSKVF